MRKIWCVLRTVSLCVCLLAAATLLSSEAKAQSPFPKTSGYENDPLNDPAQGQKNDIFDRLSSEQKKANADRFRATDEQVKRGDAAMKKGRFVEAESFYRAALIIYDKNSTAFTRLGNVLAKQKRIDDAIAVYRKVLYPDPSWGSSVQTDPETLMRYALLLVQTHQWPEAVAMHERVMSFQWLDGSPLKEIRFSAKQSQSRLFMAMAYLWIGSMQMSHSDDIGAAESFAEAVKLQPNLGIAHLYAAERPTPKTTRRAELEKAARFGQGDVKAKAEKELKAYR